MTNQIDTNSLTERAHGPRRLPRLSDMDLHTSAPPQFTPRDVSMLKDVMILQLAALCRSNGDAEIGKSLMTGKPLANGNLQHILDEARRLEVPPAHVALLEKIHAKLHPENS